MRQWHAMRWRRSDTYHWHMRAPTAGGWIVSTWAADDARAGGQPLLLPSPFGWGACTAFSRTTSTNSGHTQDRGVNAQRLVQLRLTLPTSPYHLWCLSYGRDTLSAAPHVASYLAQHVHTSFALHTRSIYTPHSPSIHAASTHLMRSFALRTVAFFCTIAMSVIPPMFSHPCVYVKKHVKEKITVDFCWKLRTISDVPR